MTDARRNQTFLDNADMLRSVLESAVDGIVVIDANGIIQWANPETSRMFGWQHEEMLDQNVSMLMAEPHRSAHDKYISNYLKTAKKKIIGIGREVEGQRKDGSLFPMHLSVSEFTNSEKHFTGIIHDTSRRKKAEDSLSQSEERLGLVLEASSDGWWDRNLIDGTEYWSDGIFRMFGYEPGEVAPSAAMKEELIHPDDRTVRQNAIRAHLQEGKPYRAEFRFRQRAGNYIWVRTLGRALRDEHGTPYRMIGTLTDISELIEKEEQLQNSARLEAIGQLTGGIAHDFNNILTVISGNLELLDMQLDKAAQRELLHEAVEASDLGAKLTDRLLTFARRRHLEPEMVDPNDVVVRLTDLLRRTVGAYIDLSTVIQPEIWKTRTDAGQLENALMNLIINARDAMPAGGRVIVETRNAILDEAYSDIIPDLKPGPYVQLTVTDTGEGMTEDALGRAFDPFFTTKKPGHGTGLGLSMVYGFAKQAGGHVTIYSEQKLGTTVNIYLPAICGAETPAALQEEDDGLQLGTGQKILVVEDDDRLRPLSVRRIVELGYRSVIAESAEEALAVLKDHDDIALVFTDIVMPGGMSGYDLAEALRKSRPDLPVLLTSGYAEELIHPEQLSKLNLRVLRKPYQKTALARALAEEIAGKRLAPTPDTPPHSA